MGKRHSDLRRKHSRQRLMQRYGLTPGEALRAIDYLMDQVRSNTHRVIESQSAARKVAIAKLPDGRLAKFVYTKTTGMVTALSMEEEE